MPSKKPITAALKTAALCLMAICLMECGGKGGDKDTRAGDGDTRAGASPAPTGDTSHQSVGATLAVAQTFTDPRDGKTYRTVKIGKQVWMAENLNYDNKSQFSSERSLCYDGDTSNCKKYGRLYTWKAATEACPAGWHLPDTSEWNMLIDYVGGEQTAGAKLKSKSPDWDGADEFYFSAMPGGHESPDGDGYDGQNGLGSWGRWWTATEYRDYYGNTYEAFYLNMKTGDANANMNFAEHSDAGLSVRCLRD